MQSQNPQPGDRIAFYGRVSQKKQHLAHQVDMGKRFFDEEGIHVPQHLWFTDKERRHKSEKRAGFQRVLTLVEKGALDWIVIATFDRWGVKDIDEFWKLRLQLKDGSVRPIPTP